MPWPKMRLTFWRKGARELWRLVIIYQRLPRGKPTDRNENFKLEYPWIGESTENSKTSVYAEVV